MQTGDGYCQNAEETTAIDVEKTTFDGLIKRSYRNNVEASYTTRLEKYLRKREMYLNA